MKIANANDTKFLYISFSNSFLDFSIINKYNQITYTTNITSKTRFKTLINIFIAQLCNFLNSNTNRFYIV